MSTLKKIRGKVILICKTKEGNMTVYKCGKRFYCRPSKSKKIWADFHYTDSFKDLQTALNIANWNEKNPEIMEECDA